MKHGAVASARLDQKRPGAAWVEYEDKRAARNAERKGLRLGRTLCKAVRVMPRAFTKAGGGGGGGEDGPGEDGAEGGGGRAAVGTTALVRGVPEVCAPPVHVS